MSTDDLLEQAQARLQELEEQEDGDELGERVEIAAGDYFIGRWRGEATMVNKEGERIPVFALWDVDGARRFHYRNAALVGEIDEARPDVGDEIVIVRGQDVEFERGGEQRTMHRYAVSAGPSPDPLPGGETLLDSPSSPAAEPADADDELPF